MPKKIKKHVPHFCWNWLNISALLIGYKEQPLAILESEKIIPIWGVLQQCHHCNKIRVISSTQIKEENEEAKDNK